MSENKIQVSVSGTVDGYMVALQTEVTSNEVVASVADLIKQLKSQGATGVRQLGQSDQNDDSDASPPIQKLATELDIDGNALKPHVGFKGSTVQIIKASQLMVTDALTMIILSIEKGLGQASLSLDEMQGLIELNGVKYEYPTTTAIFNLKKVGYINGTLYDQERRLSLTHKGEENARKAFKALMGGTAPMRKVKTQKKRTRR